MIKILLIIAILIAIALTLIRKVYPFIYKKIKKDTKIIKESMEETDDRYR